MNTSVQTGDFKKGHSNGITDLIDNSSNVGKEATQTVASIVLEILAKGRAGSLAGATAGALVQPAIWALSDKPVTGSDVVLWGLGVGVSAAAGLMGSAASVGTGVLKAIIEDQEDAIIARAIAHEPGQYRPFMASVREYGGWAGRGITAQTIALHGGVTWRVGETVWVYLKDATGRLVCDYKPVFAMEIRRPVLPLRKTGRDGDKTTFQWMRENGPQHG